ncbi:MAG: TetR/AcrR family transcriptional regulator [Acidimicrobiales bacterium]
MATETGRRPEPPLGRKQDPSRSEAILAATRELLLERGYNRFTVQDVADRSVSGVGAIYRRWPTKESLVAEAIRSGGDLSYERSDSPEADLANLIQNRAALATTHPDFVPGIVSAMRTSPEINEAMQQIYTTAAYQELVTQLLDADHPHLELLAELAPAIIVHRTIFGGHLDPDTFSQQVLALINDLPAVSTP